MLIDKPRLAQVMTGMTLMLAGVTAAVFTLLVTLFPGDVMLAPNLHLWFGVTVFFIVFIEGSLVILKRSLAMRGSQLQPANTTVWTLIGQFSQYQDMLHSVVASLFLLAILGGISFMIVRWAAANQLHTSPPFWMQLSVYAVYLLARRPLRNALRPLGAAMRRQSAKSLPFYQITPDGVAIDLNIHQIGSRSKRFVVNIGFADLDEVRAFSYAEAEAFQEYQIGPDLELWTRQTKDLFQYLKGAISRPTVYGLGEHPTGGTTILLRGPELFYFLTCNSADGSDLVTAYKAFKRRRGIGANPQ